MNATSTGRRPRVLVIGGGVAALEFVLGLIASPAQATAYSVGQQLFTTAWNLILAIVLMCWAFGWSGGKELVETSYGKAKEEAAERSEARKAKKQAKKDAAVAGSDA